MGLLQNTLVAIKRDVYGAGGKEEEEEGQDEQAYIVGAGRGKG